ncbi:hypothetical protein RIF29_38051 [Crotalaria pallida]|uniref:CRIB domain-containing protein n=1 Tax=Crotalaria pallida TaxID=3830 RepID=A0AAN9DYF2_CROPI
MRHRMERLVILPFSAGCISEASVAVGVPQPRRSRSSNTNTPAAAMKGSEGLEDSESLSDESIKNSLRFLDVVPKPNISIGFQKLFKNISQLFVEKEEELEELEMEMEIGCPTDVQHVTHIGWDGIATTANSGDTMRRWDNLIPPELLSMSSQSLLQQYDEVSNLEAKHETSSPVKTSN